MTEVFFAKTTFVESHGDRSLAYEGGPLIHHALGHDRLVKPKFSISRAVRFTAFPKGLRLQTSG